VSSEPKLPVLCRTAAEAANQFIVFVTYVFLLKHSDGSTGKRAMQAGIFDSISIEANQCRFPPPQHQNAFSPSPTKRRSRVAALGRTVFNSPRARPLSPRAPFRIVNRPALEKTAQSRHPIPLTRKLRIAQFRGRPTTAEAQTRHISTDFVRGADFGAKRSVHCTARLRLSCIARPVSLCAPH
jgi:hypothetical protein